MNNYSDTDLQTMSLTVWAEARGEPEEGQHAVAWVIRNRFSHPGWWSREKGDGIPDDTIAAVCRDKYQFSCWNASDLNNRLLYDPATVRTLGYMRIRTLCLEVLEAPAQADPTHGADHYCTRAVADKTAWARGKVPVVTIGNHQFYRLGLDGEGDR